MTNDAIRRWLAAAGRRAGRTSASADVLLRLQAVEIITFLAGPGGALELADRAAWELIASECRCWHDLDHTWWEAAPPQAAIALDEDEADIAADVSRALNYLHRRGLTVAHPDRAYLVRCVEG